MPVAEILSRLSRYEEGEPFPVEAVRAAVAQREAVTPLLLDALRDAAAHVPDLDDDSILYTYAMYLLAQFREVRALPALIEFFSWPGETVFELAEDLIIEDLGRIFAAVCGGDTAPLKALAASESVHIYVRSAALDALVVLVAWGELPRDEVVAYFRSLFAANAARGSDFIWEGLLLAVFDLHPGELLEEVRGVYSRKLIEEPLMSLKEFEDAAAEDVQSALERLGSEMPPITDTVAEMEWWACFQPAGEEELE